MYKRFGKRLIDLIVALTGLILLSPLFLVLMILVRKNLGSPVLFKQARPGKDEKIFFMYKFRTMTDEKDEKGNLLSDYMRLTSFGKKLRQSSLDELPELFNVLKGDMSLVGPRPLLIRDAFFFNDTQRKRAEVKPGITGLAQVNGRNLISWEEKLAFDCRYVEKINIIQDFKILIKTIKIILLQEGINEEGSASSTDFGVYLYNSGRINEETLKRGTQQENLIIHSYKKHDGKQSSEKKYLDF
ncbi:MAG: sugar transferase [Peptococcaceae bacterium]|nr:sugar transferase [Peptococcaceae bacterium]